MIKVNITDLQELPYAMEEAINRLRVNIGFLGSDIRKIMVISTFPNEGKSLVTLQLWRQMAEAGIPAMFLDVDMRNSVLYTKHKLEIEGEGKIIGTSNYLAGQAKVEDAICHTQYEQGDLMFNTENVINPSMLLESDRFTDLLQYLGEHYRYVFLDTPPLDLVSDGERIGSQCDGALLVVRSGVTPTNAVKASIAQLERAGCPLLGVVLNRVSSSKGGYYGKYYGKYYGGYYYGNGNK